MKWKGEKAGNFYIYTIQVCIYISCIIYIIHPSIYCRHMGTYPMQETLPRNVFGGTHDEMLCGNRTVDPEPVVGHCVALCGTKECSVCPAYVT